MSRKFKGICRSVAIVQTYALHVRETNRVVRVALGTIPADGHMIGALSLSITAVFYIQFSINKMF